MNVSRLINFNVKDFFKRSVLSSMVFSVRTTFIVRRVVPAPLSRERAVRPKALKRKHFVYETVEDTDLTEPPDLHVVLTTFVEGIGDVGDVISVSAYFAREHLLLPRKAAYATPENVEKYAELKRMRVERPKFSSIYSGMMAKILSKVVIPVFMNPEVPWVVQAKHIHAAFRQENFNVPIDAIEMPKSAVTGPDPAKDGADFAVFVMINNMERVPVRCRIFHIRPGLESAKLSADFYLDKGEIILEEQKELLDTLPTPEIIDDSKDNVSLIEKYRIQYLK